MWPLILLKSVPHAQKIYSFCPILGALQNLCKPVENCFPDSESMLLTLI